MNLRTAGIAFIVCVAAVTAAAGLAQQAPLPVAPGGPLPGAPVPAQQVPVPGAPIVPGAAVAPGAPGVVVTMPPENQPIVQPSAPPRGRGGRARGTAAPADESTTPPPPQFQNLSGVWEIQEQPGGAQTVYTHFLVQQNADNTLTGYWERGKEKLPFNGAFDGRQFKITVQDGKKTATFAGYEDNFSDMVGQMDDGDGKQPIAFTGSHRKKVPFLNNIGIGPGFGGAGQPIGP